MTMSAGTRGRRAAVALAVLSVVVGGCATAVAGSGHPTTAPAPTPAPAALVGEVERELTALRSTHYQHHTDVDEARGVFDYDCSGMVDYALSRVAPRDLRAVPVSTGPRPLAADFEHLFRTAGSGGPWRSVPTVAQSRPGDLIAWLATAYDTTGDTGLMVVVDNPRPNPARPGEWLVPVADSTISPHADDDRRTPATGLGSGTIGLVVDGTGRPTAFYWRGGQSIDAIATDIALGRPT